MPLEAELAIQKAVADQISTMKAIADANRGSLGFIPRPKMEQAVSTGQALVICSHGEVVAFVLYRHRKTDLQTTLAEICVAKDWRRRGLGQALVDALFKECTILGRSFIQLKCPVDLSANAFYQRLGFSLIRNEAGKKRPLNVWRLYVKEEN